MNHQILKTGIEFQNDTCYTAQETVYYALGDATAVKGQEYLAVSPNNLEVLDTCIFLKDKKNITLDFGGNTLLMQGRVQPILIDNCENITIKNGVAEFETSFTMQFEIMEIGPDFVMLKPSSDNCKIEDGCLVSYGVGWENNSLSERFNFLACFDKDGNPRGQILVVLGYHPNYDKHAPYVPTEYTAEWAGDLIKMNGPVEGMWRVGDFLVEESESRHRSGIMILNSRNVTIDNYRMINGVGLGISAIHTRNITINEFRLVHDERSHGLVSNSADAIHTFACSGVMTVENCKMESIIDDFINVHGNYLVVSRILDETTAEVSVAGLGLSAYCNVLDAGDEISFHKGKTMAEKERNRVIAKEVINKQTAVLRMEKPLGFVQVGDIVENLSGNTELYVKNCEFLKANSHIRLQTGGKIVFDNCTFDIPVLLTGDSNVWFESSRCLDVTIQNSRFKKERARVYIIPEFEQDEAAPFYHENIKILNNTFVTDLAMEGRNARNIEFFKNRCESGKALTLQLSGCVDVKADDSCIIEG